MAISLRKYALVGCAVFGFASPVLVHAEEDVAYSLTDGSRVAPLERFKECDDCPEMIVMPMGSFMMGAIEGESRNPYDWYGENATGRVRGPDEINIIPAEHPRHEVQIDIPFAIGRNEVTHAEWMACVDDGGCAHNPDHRALTMQGYVDLGPGHPAINISYFDVLDYVRWLNGIAGADVYRLPTEAEWEYAARAGTETRFAQGDDLSADQANFSGKATENLRKIDMPQLANRNVPIPVDDLNAANAWGLRHMSGNVAEWTQTCWTQEHLGLARATDYFALAQSQNSCRRVAKGGSYTSAMDSVRLARRSRPDESRRRSNRGFRLLRELTP